MPAHLVRESLDQASSVGCVDRAQSPAALRRCHGSSRRPSSCDARSATATPRCACGPLARACAPQSRPLPSCCCRSTSPSSLRTTRNAYAFQGGRHRRAAPGSRGWSRQVAAIAQRATRRSAALTKARSHSPFAFRVASRVLLVLRTGTTGKLLRAMPVLPGLADCRRITPSSRGRSRSGGVVPVRAGSFPFLRPRACYAVASQARVSGVRLPRRAMPVSPAQEGRRLRRRSCPGAWGTGAARPQAPDGQPEIIQNTPSPEANTPLATIRARSMPGRTRRPRCPTPKPKADMDATAAAP